MQFFPLKGQLTTWKDDRGFGFIKPDDGSKEVFLHISVLKGASRRPIVGDTILYEKAIEENGKIRASQASIEGVLNQPIASKQRSRNSNQTPNKQSTVKLPLRNKIRNKKSNNQESRKIIFGLLGMGLAIILSFSGMNFARGRFFSNSKQDVKSPSTSVNSQSTDESNQSCNIKGNISLNTGRKLYHLPNMEDYGITNIDESKGERWFCTEAEAIANGWQKAPR